MAKGLGYPCCNEMLTLTRIIYRDLKHALQHGSTEHGEKKHYNHNVDVYSLPIVLWELIHNQLPFEGMSNLQVVYAKAFKNVRPSVDVPEDLALIVTPCWKEDPNSRPNFSQIQMLLQYLLTTNLPSESTAIPPRMFPILLVQAH